MYYLPSNINKTYDVEKYFLLDEKFMLTLFRMDLCKSPDGLGAAKRSKSILAITCHTYSTMMELVTVIPYLKKTKSQKAFGANLNVRWNYKGKTGREPTHPK